jgi:ATPase family AAA domain-containing protein 3A/B
MSESLRNALTTMLYHTGTQSSQFMMVLATNRPHDLDSAVLDRIDESVEFGLPGISAREELVKLYFRMYITVPLKIKPLRPEDMKKEETNGTHTPQYSPKGSLISMPSRQDLVAEDGLAEVAKRIHGFSGREISKLMTSLQTHILFSSSSSSSRRKSKLPPFLEKKLLFEVVDAKVNEHHRTVDFGVTGYDYVNQEERSLHNSRCGSPKAGIITTPQRSPQLGALNGPKIRPEDMILSAPTDGGEIASPNINTAA